MSGRPLVAVYGMQDWDRDWCTYNQGRDPSVITRLFNVIMESKYTGLKELFAEPEEEYDSEAELEPYSHIELEPIIEESEEELDTSDIDSDEELDLSDAMQDIESRYKGLLNFLDSADESDLKRFGEAYQGIILNEVEYQASLKNNEEICEEYNCDPKHKESEKRENQRQ